MPIKIGRYTLPSQVFLAPMAGTSDKPFRQLCRSQGAALTTSEMVVIQQHLLESNKSKHRLDFSNEASPISVQIAGSEALELAKSAQQAVDFGADIIDINMGCPAKKVCNKAAGSALMQDEKLVKNILETIVQSVDCPVTLKIRTGWDVNHKNAPTIAKIAEDAGIQMLSIHGRTRADKYQGEAEYQTIKQVKSQVTIPIIANGDITSADKAKLVLDETLADGVMVGRATQGNPWIIHQIDYFLKNDKKAPAIPLKEKKTTILHHIKQIHDFYGEKMGTRLARKHIFWYATHLDKESGQIFWKKVNRITDHQLQYQLLEEFLQQL